MMGDRERFAEAACRVADEMERAADLDEQDPLRPVTRLDVRRWAQELRRLVDSDA